MGLSMSRRQVFYSSCEKEIPSFFQRIVIEIRLNNKSESFWKQFNEADNRRLSLGQRKRHQTKITIFEKHIGKLYLAFCFLGR